MKQHEVVVRASTRGIAILSFSVRVHVCVFFFFFLCVRVRAQL
jgi:hypothetical protein